MAKIIKTSFAAGELTAALNGRVDLAKYAVGAAVMRNFFVDYRGGASTRAGTRIVGVTRQFFEAPPVLIPFVFNADQAYVLELNSSRMRVIYRGAYVTHQATAIGGATTNNGLVVNVPGHVFVAGDHVVITDVIGLNRPNGVSGVNGRTFIVDSVTATNVTLHDYTSTSPATGPISAAAWSAYLSGGSMSRVYEVNTPWNSAVLYDLVYAQSADVMTVTHPDFPVYDIRRLGLTNWQIVQETYGSQAQAPSPTVTPYNPDPTKPQYFFAYVVTTVDAEGRESNASAPAVLYQRALDQSAQPNVQNILNWGDVPKAVKYCVYKAQPVPSGQEGAGPYFYGLIGNTYDNTFNDTNFAPDYTLTPPQGRNPFASNAIASVTVNTPGSGYVAPFIEVTDANGSGVSIALASNTELGAAPYGGLLRGTVLAGGSGYVAPTAVIKDAAPPGGGLTVAFNGTWIPTPGGTGFVPAPGSISISYPGQNYHKGTYAVWLTATAQGGPVGTNKLPIGIVSVVRGRVTGITYPASGITPTPLTGLSSTGTGDLVYTVAGVDVPASGATVSLALGGGTNPSVVSYLAQRRVFGGSRAAPATFYLSRPGQFTNFDVSDPVQDDDAITASLYAQEVNVISALVGVTNGLMALTSGGAFLITGDANGVVSPSTIKAPPQTFSGAQPLRPLRIGDHVLYAQARGSAVRDLAFEFAKNNFTGTDISVLSGHLLEGRRIVQWAYAEEPLKLVWAVRDDGVLLSCTYLKEHEVYGWARHDTMGRVVSVAVVPEDREDAVYLVVERYCPDIGFRFMVERMQFRLFGQNTAQNIPAQPELAWCVDAGATYPLTYPGSNILGASLIDLGILFGPTVSMGGTGYTQPIVEVLDPTGTGAVVTATVVAGVVTGLTVVNQGKNYTSPRVNIVDPSPLAAGAVANIRAGNLMTAFFSSFTFTNDDVGKVLRVRGGFGTVTSCPAPNQLVIDMKRLPAMLPNIPGYIMPVALATTWSLTRPVSVIGGLDHLNNSTVQVVVDGAVQAPAKVVDGCITLEQPGTIIVAGHGYTCQLQTMQLEVNPGTVQGQRKAIPQIIARVKDARGLSYGNRWDGLIEHKEVGGDYSGQPVQFQLGGKQIEGAYMGAPVSYVPFTYDDQLLNARPGWDVPGVVCIQQSYPMPSTVLAVVMEVEQGDVG